jgi:hypothetical protein
MTIRTTSKTVTFHRTFRLKGVDRLLPPAGYRVVTHTAGLKPAAR